MKVDLYDLAHAEYTAQPEFPALEAEAHKRGYRKATASEVRASATRQAWAEDLHCWRGGLWARLETPNDSLSRPQRPAQE